jgi:uroporphyrinogen-III synthase
MTSTEGRGADTAPRPLAGRRVAVTRAQEQGDSLADALRALGAEVLEAPAIRIEPLDPSPLLRALAALADYRWLVLTSQNAVAIVWDSLRALGLDERSLAPLRVCVVGPATAAAVRARGVEPAVVPERFVAEGVLAAMALRDDVRGARMLYPVAAGARDTLRGGLVALGAEVDAIPVYHSVPDERGLASLAVRLERGEVDAVTVASGSAVRALVEVAGLARARAARLVTIGPATSAVARAVGLEPSAEAREATVPALAAAVVHLLGGDE